MLSRVDWLREIEAGSVVVTPLVEANLQPASLDLTLDRYILRPRKNLLELEVQTVSARMPAEMRSRQWVEEEMCDGACILLPGQFMLGQTVEHIAVDAGFAIDLAGRSSMGRDGIFMHVQAGYVDPGFIGNITLEIYNASLWAYEFEYGQRVLTARLIRLETPTDRPYDGKYQYENRPLGARTYSDYGGSPR